MMEFTRTDETTCIVEKKFDDSSEDYIAGYLHYMSFIKEWVFQSNGKGLLRLSQLEEISAKINKLNKELK